jgi:pimeloyl-ACP methyl ester carboxylesterase
LFGGSTDRAILEAARAIALERNIDDVIRGIRVFHGRRDRDDFVARWPHRLVVISGEHDTTPPTATTSRLAAAAPAGEFHLIPNCGHYVNLERRHAFDNILEQVVNDALAHSARLDHG